MGASEGTSPLGGGVSLPEIRASVTATLHARTCRRCASARVRCGDPPDPAIALEAAHRRLRASHESLLASRARVDAKYVTEVERRSEMAADAADARDAADAARRERDDAELRAKRAERATRIEREARRRDRVTFEKESARARRARGGNRRPGGSARGASLAVRSRNETPPKHAARAAERARARTGGGGDRARRRRGALAGGRGGARRRGRSLWRSPRPRLSRRRERLRLDETRRRCGETRTTNAPASNADSRRRAAKTQRLARTPPRRRRRLRRRKRASP